MSPNGIWMPDCPAGKVPCRAARVPVSLRIFGAFLAALGLGSLLFCISIYRQHTAICEITRLGGHIETRPGGPKWLRALVADGWMKLLDNPFLVNLESGEATDAALDYVARFDGLEMLFLGDTDVTDAGLRRLRGLSNLRVLQLDDTQVSDAGLANLVGLTRLQRLILDHTRVTDAGMVHVRQIAGLRELGLSNTRISDAGLLHVSRLTKLEAIWVRNTFVTFAGVADLCRELPGLTTVAR